MWTVRYKVFYNGHERIERFDNEPPARERFEQLKEPHAKAKADQLPYWWFVGYNQVWLYDEDDLICGYVSHKPGPHDFVRKT